MIPENRPTTPDLLSIFVKTPNRNKWKVPESLGETRSMGLGNQLRTEPTAAAPCAIHKTEHVLDLGSRWIRFNHRPKLGHHSASRRRNFWRGGWLRSGGTCRRGAGRDDGDRGCNLKKNVINNKWQASKR